MRVLVCFLAVFAAASAAKLESYMMLRTPPADCNAAAQNPPTPVYAFLPTDAQAVLWFYVTGAKAGDVVGSEYFTPSGQRYAPTSGNWPPIPSDGSYCIGDQPLQIAGAPLASMPGLWTVKVTYNGVPFFTLTFTIAAPGGNLLVNGNFEQPGVERLGLTRGSTYIPGWVVTRDTVDYQTSWFTCPEGRFCLDLDGHPGAGALAQTFATAAATRYRVSFVWAGNTDCLPRVKKLRVSAAGQQADYSFDTTGRSRSNMGWTPVTWDFMANAASTALEFQSMDDPATTCGPLLDDVRVTVVPPAACTYAISPASVQALASGGTGSVSVSSGSGCAWTATSNATWITVTAGASGTGSGAVSYSVAANTGTSSRTGTLTIAGQTFTLTQAGAGAAPKPLISTGGVLNAADYTGVAAPGGMLSIFGSNLAPATRTATSVPLPTTLEGVSVDIYDGNTVLQAPLFFVSAGQINAQLPFETASASVLVRVRTAGGESLAERLSVAARAPRLFTKTQDGKGEPILLHSNYSYVSADSPARPGEALMLLLTGLGAVRPAAATGGAGGNGGSLGPLNLVTGPVSIKIGDQTVPVQFAGLAPGFVGVYQVNFVVPAEAAGGWQEMEVHCEDGISQTGVAFRIRTLPPPLTTATVGREGKVVEASGIRVEIPAGALSASKNLQVTQIPAEEQEGQLSHTYALEGLPLTLGAPLTITLETVRAPEAEGNLYVFVETSAEEGAPLAAGLLPAQLDGTRATVTLPAGSLVGFRAGASKPPPTRRASISTGSRAPNASDMLLSVARLTVSAIQLVTTTTGRPGGSFELRHPPGLGLLGPAAAMLDKRLEQLEFAKTTIEQTVGLRWGPNYDWRREVLTLPQASRRYWGSATAGEWDMWRVAKAVLGRLQGEAVLPYAMIVNPLYLNWNDAPALRILDMAAGRELLSLYARSYLPAGYASAVSAVPVRWRWMMEAASTWFQHYYAQGGPDSKYEPLEVPAGSTRLFFDFLLRRGLDYHFEDDTDERYLAGLKVAREHGAGAAMFLHYLVRKRGNPTIIRDLFEAWERHPYLPLAALDAVLAGGLGAAWREFCGEWMAGKVYAGEAFPAPGDIAQLAAGPRLDLRYARTAKARWDAPELGARLYEVALPRDWPASKSLKIWLNDPAGNSGAVAYSYLPGSPPAWAHLKTFQGETQIEGAGRLGSQDARIFILVSSGYGRAPLQGITLTVGDPNLLEELHRATKLYTYVAGELLGATGQSDFRIDTADDAYKGYAHGLDWGITRPGEFSRTLNAWAAASQGTPGQSSFRDHGYEINIEFSEDGSTVLRAETFYWRNIGADKYKLTFILKDLPFSSAVDYEVPYRERLYLFRISGRDKQAHLPFFRIEAVEGGRQSIIDGLNWNSSRSIPELRVALFAPR